MRKRSFAIGAVLVLTLALGWPAAPAPATSTKIVVIVMENMPYSKIVGSSSAPFINNTMIADGVLATNYVGFSGSVHDYLAMTSGITSETLAPSSENIFHQLQSAGTSWVEYEQSMPSRCSLTASAGLIPGTNVPLYSKKHNPAVYYNDITQNAKLCKAHVQPMPSSFAGLTLRSFTYLVPNQCWDMHTSCSAISGTANEIRTGDDWLAAHVPDLVADGATVVLTWDEGNKTSENIVTVKYGAGESSGSDATSYNHYSLLAGLEDAFGRARVNGAQGATALPIP